MNTIKYTQSDRFIYNNEIKPYLPHRIFDAHAHLQIPRFHPDLEESLSLSKDPQLNTIDMPVLRQWWQTLFPDARIGGLVLGTPTKQCDMKGINQCLGQSVYEPDVRFSILTGPQFSADELEKQIIALKPHGFKPYMCFSQLKNYNDSGICDIIPESQIALADKYGLAITLHVAKPRGMADSDNLNDIIRLVKEYPRCNFILAHCGRCFIAPNMEDALKKLPVASNLWIDTSAVCDTGVFLYLLDRYDRTKLLFGTDLVMAAGFRGSYIRMGTSWEWITEDKISKAGGMEIKATFAAYENLCAMLHAAKFCKLTEADRNNIFYNNAARLFKLS
jgi:predicted TIM-barrel fold metal-dependent hydrolase